MDFYSIKMLIKKNLSIRFFHFDIYLAQEQDETFKLYSNEDHGFKRSWMAFEFEKSMKINYRSHPVEEFQLRHIRYW